MRVRDWMSPDPMTVTPSTEVAEARRLLDTYGIRHLPVVDRERVVGMISDRDIRSSRAALYPAVDQQVRGDRASGVDDRAEQPVVATVMSTPVHVVTADQDMETATRSMLSRRIGALPVLSDGQLVGLITTTDCLLASLTPLCDNVGVREFSAP